MSPDTIHLVFKTHLDIGFTDHAETVRRLYHERFIPQALATAEHFWREDPSNPKFIWTTGAWLIHDHLTTRSPAEVARLEGAIERGLIRWHGLPFTTHSELMSPALFRAGLSYSSELDARFGMTTRAAKMTDVPGHTLGIVPLMAQAGLRFLHLGVNSASPVPEVPELFRWRAPTGAEIVVMYQPSYGETHLPAGMTDALSFAHTEDNIGPQSVAQTVHVLRDLAHRHPGSCIRAATLEDYGALLWERREALPVFSGEIGDSWIHGVASDPLKLARFRTLQRLYDQFEAEGLTPERLAFGRGLAMVAEHTWGVDIKTYLRDESAWDRLAFEDARAHDPRFSFCEASWAEQRRYLDQAVARLDSRDQVRAGEAEVPLAAPPRMDGAILGGGVHRVGGWRIDVDPSTGDIAGLTPPDGEALEGRGGRLFAFRHRSFDASDLGRHLDSYLTSRPEWAILDHDKPGLSKAETLRPGDFAPRLEDIRRDGETLATRAIMPAEAHSDLGAPKEAEWHITAGEQGLVLSLVLRHKPANRMPEMGRVELTPEGPEGWQFLKTGLWVDPTATARAGGGALHAVFAARTRVSSRVLTVKPLDTMLTGASGVDPMLFTAEPPHYRKGLSFQIYNNKWGTNFPMWWEGDLLARFEMWL